MAADNIETNITEAVRSRLSFFRKQSNSLTFEGVRRLLEKDLGLETFTLDAHKKLIKTLLQENFYSSEDEDASGNVKENEVENSELENTSRSLETLEQNMKTRKHDVVRKEDKNLLEEQKQKESNIDKPDPEEKDQAESKEGAYEINVKNESSLEVTEAVIKEAIFKRASYLRAEIESISLGGVRRILEQDLRLETKALDVHKTFISKLVDEVLTSPPDEPDNVKETKKKSSKGKKNDSEEDEIKEMKSDTMEDSMENTEISRDDEDVGQNNETLNASKSKKIRKEDLGSATLKGRKRKKETESEYKKSVKKPKKKKSVEDKDAEPLKSESTRREVESTDEFEDSLKNRASEDSDSGASDNKDVNIKRKKATNPVVDGEQVQNLKKIIRSCGMTVPPAVFKKAKQQSESKREAYLIQELAAILKKEGLSLNPTDKEVKAVKRRKERAKDLEGIDTTNIISDSRSRRASSNFYIAPPQYKVSNEDDEDSSDDEDRKSSEDDGIYKRIQQQRGRNLSERCVVIASIASGREK